MNRLRSPSPTKSLPGLPKTWRISHAAWFSLLAVVLFARSDCSAVKIPGYETDFPPLVGYAITIPRGAKTNKLFTSNSIPFGNFIVGEPEKTAMRYQQVFKASEFADLPADGAFLDSIYLRAGCGGRNGSLIDSNMVVRFCHTEREPDQLSTVFDENLGNDVIRVANRASYFIRGSGAEVCTQGEGPGSFEETIRLSTPFLYQPSRGNLLLDLTIPVHRPSDETPWHRLLMESVDEPDDGVSSVYATPDTAEVATTASTSGLVMNFQCFPFPKLHVFIEGTNVLIYYRPKPKDVSLQTRGLGENTAWTPYLARPPVFGDSPLSLSTLYVIPAASLTAPTLFRLFWDSPQLGITNPASGSVARDPFHHP